MGLRCLGGVHNTLRRNIAHKPSWWFGSSPSAEQSCGTMRTQISSVVCTNRCPWRAAASTPIGCRPARQLARRGAHHRPSRCPCRIASSCRLARSRRPQAEIGVVRRGCIGCERAGAFEERLRDDESDIAANRRQMQQAASASSTDRRAHAVTRRSSSPRSEGHPR